MMRTVFNVICVAGLALSLAVRAQAPASAGVDRELLNSERIEQAFGSYGIEVLSSTPELRVSNLYSTQGGRRVCRTFAVVVYPHGVDEGLLAEHAAILDGGSIGATFAASGWRVRKDHRYFGEIASTPKLESLMGGIEPTRLAVHVYGLSVAKDDADTEYASIVEVHHPDYLGLAELRAIYGDDPPPVDDAVARLLRLTAEQMR